MSRNQIGGIFLLVIILAFIALVSGLLYFKFKYSDVTESESNLIATKYDDIESKTETAPSQVTKLITYTNLKYGYSIQFPPLLAVREFPDTKTGAGFRPVSEPEDPQYEVISIDVLRRTADMAQTPLSDYAKTAAAVEIQNYTKLNSIEEVKTDSGLVGYKTTWIVLPMRVLGASTSAQNSVSLPITYFDLPGETIPSTVQVTLNDPEYIEAYNLMIKTFSE